MSTAQAQQEGSAPGLPNLRPDIQKIMGSASSVLLGKDRELLHAMTCMVGGGHLLVEDVPGVGKTTMVYLLGRLMGLGLNRIQFTNDLLPGDILGTMVYRREKEEFEFKKGPIFGQLILADELNRATPKTQSALLQCMEEHKVSVEGQTFTLEEPFLIVATQNPFYQVGTFQLPESQLDRFFMSLHLDFPERDFEKKILLQPDSRYEIEKLEPVISDQDLVRMRKEASLVKVSEALLDYLLDLIEKGRSDYEEGAYLSPRAGKDLIQAARTLAYFQERDFVVPDDVQEVAPFVLGHRLSGGKGVSHGQKIIRELISKTPLNSL